MPHSLYAIPHSLYSGRARSYLIKNNIPFEEFSCGHESFKAEIVPEAKLKAYEKDSAEMPLKHIFALSD